MPDTLQELELRLIRPDDVLNKISLGNEAYTPLKIFLKKNALEFHQYEIAKTYVLASVEEKNCKVWGYITLMNSEIALNKDQRPQEVSALDKYEAFPAVKIARLATDKAIRGRGYGKFMVQFCATLVKNELMPHIGCRFLVVDSKRDSIEFYQKLGFDLLDTDANHKDDNPLMFFDIYKNAFLI